MTVLELFCGSKSFANVAKSLGHQTFTSDFNPDFNSDYTVDIFEFDIDKLPFKPDVIWASPPCESFSVSSIGKHWNINNTPKTENAKQAVKMINKTLEIIDKLNPKYFFIENPRGKLRKLPMMQNMVRHTVTYCQYGDFRMKPTDIWTNCLVWKPKPPCKNGMNCHTSAPRGSRTGTQGYKDYYERSKIPPELCKEIILSW